MKKPLAGGYGRYPVINPIRLFSKRKVYYWTRVPWITKFNQAIAKLFLEEIR